MKYRDLEKGTAGGRTEDFDLPGGAVVSIRVVPLLAGREREIETLAEAYARSQKAEPKAGEPTYERGIYAATVLLAVLDPDDGARFFASVEEILDPDRGLDRGRLAYLFELQQQAQADFAPQIGSLTAAQYFQWLEKTAEAGDGAELPFERSPRVMQRAYHRGTARSYRSLILAHVEAQREIEALRSEIASLRDRSSPTPSAPASGTNSPGSAGSHGASEGASG